LKKILFFPLLESLPSGHHQVASAIAGYISRRSDGIECKKVDLLSSWNPKVESMITKTYLSWIQRYPASYALVYKKLAYQSKQKRSYKHYDLLFQHKLEKIITEEQPDLIICTHAFPSYLLSNLKKSGACHVPVVNIYTDFFINDVWGSEMIEYHFVSDTKMKTYLMEHNHVPERKIWITGIPVDESFVSTNAQTPNRKLTVLLSGGSAGLGNIMELVNQAGYDQRINFYVLCGNNKQLYHELSNRNNYNVHPLPYITSRKQMNALYNSVDAIITKPGGVTVSEAMKANVPIFIHSALPGQEEINLTHLKEQGLVFPIKEGRNLADQLSEILHNEPRMREYKRCVAQYLNTQDLSKPEDIFHFIEDIVGVNNGKLIETL